MLVTLASCRMSVALNFRVDGTCLDTPRLSATPVRASDAGYQVISDRERSYRAVQ